MSIPATYSKDLWGPTDPTSEEEAWLSKEEARWTKEIASRLSTIERRQVSDREAHAVVRLA